ncbi:MAG: hypothetical protein AB7S69_12800 [Salinivirgaceae bacterium]
MTYLNRYEELLKQQDINYLRLGDLLLREYGSIIIPLGPALIPEPTTQIDTATVFSHLKGKLLWWSHQKPGYDSNNWYAVIKDKHLSLDEYRTANIRNQIRKGLKNFEIKRIEPELLVQQGFVIYQKAFEAFNTKAPMELTEYQKFITTLHDFDDIIHVVGVFHQQKLIGYALIYCYGTLEAGISEIRILPEYNNLYPSYALFHWLSEEYLAKRKFEYISDGYRNLLHETNIQDLLIRKFGFRKQGLYLECELKKPFNYFFNSYSLPLLKLVSFNRVRAITTLLEIRQQQKRLPK